LRPDNPEILAGLRKALLEYLAPEVTSVYGRSQLMYATSLLQTAAREAEDGVHALVKENEALRRLLEDAGGRLRGVSPADDALLEELSALPPAAGDLRFSSLRAENSGLLSLLVRLQAACEETASEAARSVYSETLTFLRRRNQGEWV
jgi:hypothetical protein